MQMVFNKIGSWLLGLSLFICFIAVGVENRWPINYMVNVTAGILIEKSYNIGINISSF